MGLEDFWLEHASGSFSLDVTPDRKTPSIELVLSGTAANPDGGIVVRCKAQGFRLAGDKGMKVPKLKFDNLKVSLSLGCKLCFSYDARKQVCVEWCGDCVLVIVFVCVIFGLFSLTFLKTITKRANSQQKTNQ
jgi:hypothetical protein